MVYVGHRSMIEVIVEEAGFFHLQALAPRNPLELTWTGDTG